MEINQKTQKNHSCNICQKDYSSKSSLCNHKKKFHTKKINILPSNNNQYFCKTCNRNFNNYQNRWKHEKICKKKNDKTSILEQENNIIKDEINLLKETNKILKAKNNKLRKRNIEVKVEPINNSLIDIIVNKSKAIDQLKNMIEQKPEIDKNIIEFNGESKLILNDVTIISRLSDGYINATQLCKAGNKNFTDWYSLDSTKKLINEMGNLPYSFIDITNQFEWIHPDLAIQLAYWISFSFGLKVSKWIRTLLNESFISMINEQNERIKLLENTYVKRQQRKDYQDKNVIYMLTTEENKKKGIYIIGKAKDLKNRLSTYNKTSEHEVVYYKSCKNETEMNAAEILILTKLSSYKEKANRDRFILPNDKNTDFFTDIIDKCIDFI
jgi:hypothetical protein